MSQKFKKIQNSNDESTAYGKWFATAVYDQKFVTTKQLADFIQKQASVKRSDIMAVLDELGDAMKHYFELGQKVKLDGIGIFKVGFSSIGTTEKEDCGAATITTRRVHRGRPDGEQAGQDHPEVRRGQGAGEGRGLRGDLRPCLRA